jgi:serine/threonine-protein kinase HipA
MRSIIEIHRHGEWAKAAEFIPAEAGHRATFEYLPEYVFLDDAEPISLTLPLTMERQGVDGDFGHPCCPPFLLDLVPQGRGRDLLAKELALANTEDNDLSLAQHGAFNPVGNLRLNTAVAFYQRRRAAHEEACRGFTLKDILDRPDTFREHIFVHEMLSAGTAGLQGVAPKFLLTRSRNDLWYADAALPDLEAESHWLVKMPRGRDVSDLTILRNEAAYLEVANSCGLRTAGKPILRGDMLFLPRFDRLHTPNRNVLRLHQETLASLAGCYDHGLMIPLFDLVEAFRCHVHDPVGEMIEFIKRDILNLALRNPDNHARNTSVQRLADGRVQLTPLYDFAPMYLDRDLIARGCRWKRDRGEISDWNDIVAQLQTDEQGRDQILVALKTFAEKVENLPGVMASCGVDPFIIDDCKPSIENQYERLSKLKVQGHGSTP